MKLPWRWPTPEGLPPASALILIAALVALLALASQAVPVEPRRLATGAGELVRFTIALFSEPEWSYLPRLGRQMLATFEIALVATVLAAVLSLPIGMLAASNAGTPAWVWRPTRLILGMVRALPEVVWALVFLAGVGLGPTAGVMALAVVTVGLLGRLFAEAMEVVDPRAIEGVQAQGAGWLQVRRFAVLPQARPDLIGAGLATFEHNLRSATVVGVVGAGGIGYDLYMAMHLFQFGRLALIIAAIALMVSAVDAISGRLRAGVIG